MARPEKVSRFAFCSQCVSCMDQWHRKKVLGLFARDHPELQDSYVRAVPKPDPHKTVVGRLSKKAYARTLCASGFSLTVP